MLQTVNYGTVDCGAGLQVTSCAYCPAALRVCSCCNPAWVQATVSAAGWLSCAPLLQQVVVTTDSQHTLAVLLTTLSTQDHQAARQQVAEVRVALGSWQTAPSRPTWTADSPTSHTGLPPQAC